MAEERHIQLAADDQRLLTLVGCIHGLVLELDEQIRYVNIWADDPDLLAVPREKALGRTINEVLGPEIGAGFTALVKDVFATGETRHLEYPLVIRARTHWFFADIKRVTVGDRTTVVLFGRDISERKRQEERLQRSEERFRLAAQATNDVLYDWDVATGNMEWGPNANAVFADVLAEHCDAWFARLHPEDTGRVRGSLEKAFGTGAASWESAYRFRRGDGTYSDVLDRGFIVRGAEGTPVRMVGSMTDVTRLNRLQAQVVQQDRLAAMGILAAGVGHEINNPLCYVLGNIDLALERESLARTPEEREREDEARSALMDARDGANRIKDIVKSLKLFSRGDTDLGARAVQVEHVVEQALKMAEGHIRHRARLVRNYASVPSVFVNESRLGQVCLNLVINAAQAIVSGSCQSNEIVVTTGTDDRGRVFLSVSDTGAGIQPEHIDRIFDPFFTTKPVGVGTGIGLSVCVGILQSMGGELTVKSSPHERTTFTVTLPVARSAVSVVDGTSLPAPSPARSRVLVVDDDGAVGRYIGRALKEDCDVIVVDSARGAIARLEAGADFDIILCDVMMPEMNGIELYGVFRERFSAIVPRVHFMTGGVFTPEAARFLDELPHPPLEKPMRREVLRALVAEHAS